ncbi:MAG: PD-(D/E)XK nuclease family protein [Ilumatobacter sp.]|uniref:RecB family exonuclease n=1 Tax=Ilumatobacter sp. TaxID=1967498 RepID=UPI00260AE8F8|nr:PD-(D/E)XK nuclease family protein [Ilumatobacter sp.]MDJ0768406.1 PD-(D/E)XK nuclease family protein [Ilumatobacter sp.]
MTDVAAEATWTVPTSLSPSRVESFLSCPLAFRFSSIEKLPDPPTVATTRGSLVHRALELFFLRPVAERTPAALDRCADAAIAEYREHPDFVQLSLTPDEVERFDHECRELVANYLGMEDPTTVRDIGLELKLEAPVGDLTLRGIIDRLELDPQGELVVTDYKTGRAPSPNWERKSLSGVHFYAFLCESVFGRRPAAIRLMYLKSGETITATPSAQSTKFMTTRTSAVWKAVATACERDDFRPRQSALCNHCAYQRWCPEFGGDPALAAAEAPVVLGGAVPA